MPQRDAAPTDVGLPGPPHGPSPAVARGRGPTRPRGPAASGKARWWRGWWTGRPQPAGSHGAGPLNASIVAAIPRPGGIGRVYTPVFMRQPVPKLLGMQLAPGALAAVAEFVDRNRAALLDHWTGATDSLDLLRAIGDGERRGG